MAISILCVAMNPSAVFIQTLVGLVYGLRDMGFSILNMLGCCCSIDQVRKHGNFWAKERNVSTELTATKSSFWRVSFDNLNFKIKYAKKLTTSGPNKMLNLITTQVCCRTSSNRDLNVLPFPVSLSYQCTNKLVPMLDTMITPTCDMFTVDLLDPILSFYNFCVTKICQERSLHANDKPVFIELRKHFPHFTPKKSDIIVYATVEEAHSATKDDIVRYLNSLKHDLKIGEPNFPKIIALCGDQQTYSIIVNFKLTNPVEYAWFNPLPGEWHLMKLVSEVIRDLIWDGGLKQFSCACGIKGELVQWQDINIMLLGTYEALLELSYQKFNSTSSSHNIINFWECLSYVQSQENVNELWSLVLHFYQGFYFSIRSGNWMLRNACISTNFFCI